MNIEEIDARAEEIHNADPDFKEAVKLSQSNAVAIGNGENRAHKHFAHSWLNGFQAMPLIATMDVEMQQQFVTQFGDLTYAMEAAQYPDWERCKRLAERTQAEFTELRALGELRAQLERGELKNGTH
jgi:hypothetical protein